MKSFDQSAPGLFIDEPVTLIGVMDAPFAALNGAREPFPLLLRRVVERAEQA
jgi:hypothetical protein